jgi:hypothetical protein
MGFKEEFGKKAGEGVGDIFKRIITGIFDVIASGARFAFFPKPATQEKSWFKVNNALIAFWAFMIGVTSLSTCSFSPPKSEQQSNTGHNDGHISVTSQLRYGTPPVMPNDAHFEPTRDTYKHEYFTIDSVRYIKYRIMGNGKKTWVLIPTDVSTCSVVPKEEKVILVTTIPPRYEMNMEGTVKVSIPVRNIPSFFERIPHLFKDNNELVGYKTNWVWLREHWELIDTSRSDILAQASKRHPGGLVCF